MERRPLLVAFEGPDGSGKTTLLKTVQDALDAEGIFSSRVSMIPEGPIREILLNQKNLDPIQQLLLFGAAQVEVASIIRQRLEKGHVVLLDRTPISRAVYQAATYQIQSQNKAMEAIVGEFPCIDLLVYLHISPEEASRRLKARSGDEIDELERLVEQNRETYHQLYEDEIQATVNYNEHLKNCGMRHTDVYTVEAQYPAKMLASMVVSEIIERLSN